METREQKINNLNRDISTLIAFYDKAVDTIDNVVFPVLIKRNRVKWKEYTINLLKERVGNIAVISKGLKSLYIDFHSPVNTYIPIAFDVADEYDDGHMRININLANESWAATRPKIIAEREALATALTKSELYYDTITKLRELWLIEREIPNEIKTLIK